MSIDMKSVIDEFLWTITENDNWYPQGSYMVVQLPQSSEVLIKRTSTYDGWRTNCHHAEREYLIPALSGELQIILNKQIQLEQLSIDTEEQQEVLNNQMKEQKSQQKDLRKLLEAFEQHLEEDKQQADNIKNSQCFTIYFSAYTTCVGCMKHLANFVKEIESEGSHMKLDLRVTNVIGKVHQSQLLEATKTLSQLEEQGHLTLSPFGREDLNEVMRLIHRVFDIDSKRQQEIEDVGKSMEERRTHLIQKIKLLREERIVLPLALQRAEVFKAFYTSYLHREPYHEDHAVFCIAQFSQDDVARVYRNTHSPTVHAEENMVNDLKQVLEKSLSWSDFQQILIYQNYSPCASCSKTQLIPIIMKMSENMNVSMTIKAVGPYKIVRAHCINITSQLEKEEGIKGPCHGKSCTTDYYRYYEETARALRELTTHHIHLQSFQQYSDWKDLVDLINESPDLIGPEVTFTLQDYKIKYTKSREAEDKGVMEDLQAALTPPTATY